MKAKGLEFFDDLIVIYKSQIEIKDKYPRMRSLLERVCKDLTYKEVIQFPNLFSRLNFVCDKTKLGKGKTYQINSLRINANKVLHSGLLPSEDEFLQDLKSLANTLSHFYGITIPQELSAVLPTKEYYKPKPRRGEKRNRLRVEVVSTDEHYIYAFDEENSTEDPIKIKHHITGLNAEFNPTVANLWKSCQLNLIDVTIDDEGVYYPGLIILEPDYLIDVSSLAECMKEYGRHPLNFIQSKFEAIKNSKHILLGNIANLFLDEFVNEKPESPVVYNETIKKAFKSSPFEFSTCEEIDADFFQDTQSQFLNIRNIVNNVFPNGGIERENALLEPNFICEQLGVQGRLDFLQLDSKNRKKIVIELKSGKAPFPDADTSLIGINHRSQAFLYQIIIQQILEVSFKDLSTFILYSKYADPKSNLRLTYPSMAEIREILNIRNLIVVNERSIAIDRTESKTKAIVSSITPETLITNKNTNQNFLDRFIIPQINHFTSFFQNASPIESEYFHSFYSFVAREHYNSKAGDSQSDSTKGISSLWRSTLEEKFESGDILTDLTIEENRTSLNQPTIKLKIPKYEQDFLPNFRRGDIVILYERNKRGDDVRNKQIFKGSIQDINPTEITIRIRYQQRNQSVLPQESKYAVEHDFLDSSYNTMYRGLYSFLQANKDRKDLLLHQRLPGQDITRNLSHSYGSKDIDQIVLKAKMAKDYFLLIGPPGTGKTSLALKSMVEEFLVDPNCNILLLSYTNRAVDEICDSLNTVNGNPDYIRIGTELSCDPTHRDRLLDRIIVQADNRNEVKAKIQEHRIFVGTVASISGKTELFKLKHFQVAIIDEASQILEPSLLGILSAKNKAGGNAVDKFILIGDHKQLPAVVLQQEEFSKIENPDLQKIGLYDRRNSLFERLYNLHKSQKSSLVWGMLHKQGRMHPEIALFPNYSFYKGQLDVVPREHQLSNLEYRHVDHSNPFQKLIASKRLAFIPSETHTSDKTNKTNTFEAKIAKELVKNIYDLYNSSGIPFSSDETVGIIAPYRSQIALIRREIHDLKIPALDAISVDTVERFQGSQRDIIIYTFSVNQHYQLDFLANTIEDDGQTIDRKLNVALTRAKKQLFVLGNPAILSTNLIYYRFIEFIRSKSGYIFERPAEILKGNFVVEDPDTDVQIGNNIYEPDSSFVSAFEKVVIQPIQADERTTYSHMLYGNNNDFNRMNVIEYGRTDFDQETLGFTSEEKVNLYCFYNMRKHYFSSLAIFNTFKDYLNTAFINSNHRIAFIDFGCGPLTSGLAFQKSFAETPNFHFDYVGIDTSSAMLEKAQEFAVSGLFNRDTRFQFASSINTISEDYWDSIFTLSNTVILNFSYLFGNLSSDDAESLALRMNALLDKFPLNRFILVFQNSALEKRNRSYNSFKKLVPRLRSITEFPKVETVMYRNAIMSKYDKSETVFYELLSNA